MKTVREKSRLEGGMRIRAEAQNNKPLFSLVIAVFNGARYLDQAILSVINQSFDNFEFIIVDGGSKDGTLDIIRRYEDKITHWISEPDCGIYDAWNKGVALARG